MADERVLQSSSGDDVELPTRRSHWRYLLPIVWVGLGARLVVAAQRNEPINQDFLSLALIAFFMTTALLGSRVWLWFHDHWAELSARSATRS